MPKTENKRIYQNRYLMISRGLVMFSERTKLIREILLIPCQRNKPCFLFCRTLFILPSQLPVTISIIAVYRFVIKVNANHCISAQQTRLFLHLAKRRIFSPRGSNFLVRTAASAYPSRMLAKRNHYADNCWRCHNNGLSLHPQSLKSLPKHNLYFS